MMRSHRLTVGNTSLWKKCWDLCGVLCLMVALFSGVIQGAEINDFDPTTNPLTVHLLPHSHCDAGYKKTVEEYYATEVKQILTSVTSYLDPSTKKKKGESSQSSQLHRFVWSEVVFLELWFDDPSVDASLKQSFRRLVKQGTIELVNGGFVMHDEAITRYESQIQQTSLGHSILHRIFEEDEDKDHYSPEITTGYQIDSFGPSSFTPQFLKLAGYNMLITNRIPQTLKDEMKLDQSLEFWWYPSEAHHGGSGKMFVHVYDHHYAIPTGFDWEDESPTNYKGASPITPENVADRSDQFVNEIVMERAPYYRTPHLLVPFGTDFRFQDAALQFDNMDQIVDFINSNPDRYMGKTGRTITLRYSTANEYLQNIASHMISKDGPFSPNDSTTPTGTEDTQAFFPSHTGSLFFPYVTSGPSPQIFSGFYSQYPNLKQNVRVAEQLLRAADVMKASYALSTASNLSKANSVVVNNNSTSVAFGLMEHARRIVMVMQHHDALPGTMYHFVVSDYMVKLQIACTELAVALSIFLSQSTVDNDSETATLQNDAYSVPKASGNIVGGGAYLSRTSIILGAPGSVDISHLLRVQMGANTPSRFDVINPRTWAAVQDPVHILTSRDDVIVRDVNGNSILSQANLLNQENLLGMFIISFLADVPAIGTTSFTIETCDVTTTTDVVPIRGPSCAFSVTDIDHASLHEKAVGYDDNLRMTIKEETVMNRETGEGLMFFDKSQTSGYELSHRLMKYDGSEDTVYAFNDVNGSLIPSHVPSVSGTIAGIAGPIYSEIVVSFQGGHYTRYRIYNVTKHSALFKQVQMEIETEPLPVNSNFVSEFQTRLSKTTLVNVENGIRKSFHNYDPKSSIRANFQPLVSRAWLEDSIDESGTDFHIISVDPRGVASKDKGDLHVMWQRRNGDALSYLKSGDDPSRLRSQIWLSFDTHSGQDEKTQRTAERSLASDLIAIELDRTSPLVSTEMFAGPISQDVYVATVLSPSPGLLRLVIEGIGEGQSKLKLKDVLPDSGTLGVLLRSLTFSTGNIMAEACSLTVEDDGLVVLIEPSELCAIEIELQTPNSATNARSRFANMINRAPVSFLLVIAMALWAIVLFMAFTSAKAAETQALLESYGTVSISEEEFEPAEEYHDGENGLTRNLNRKDASALVPTYDDDSEEEGDII
eukprot:CAMPEP_0198284144 /NCGR_PEP_ID=MMETSP1449-20131203/3636_1 /TAXON_ID=420275 /ORGANISM="Attheya septentrionalis, Strain CCMP2084" /LENGTH=1164 /DNA_ID=CAMNT_0043981071 /DNA_START=337 /DNA_END=3831 /DNA_ORIENTATION=-